MEAQREGEKCRHRQWVVVGLLAITMAVASSLEAQVTSRSAGRRAPSGGNPIALAVTTDKPTYTAGDTIFVTAIATYGDGSAVAPVRKSKIEIKDSAGRRVARDSLENQGSGTFTYAFATRPDARIGSWTIEIEIEDTGRNKKKEETRVELTAGTTPCPDADGDGFTDMDCGGTDCNDSDSSIHPGAEDVCGDGIDQDCSGADLECVPACNATRPKPSRCTAR
ncbi:MAG: MG2 domain-containing protein [Acidobacteriota bacterium]